jgi:TRAP-type uncharacterized transport system substrate-binding protein
MDGPRAAEAGVKPAAEVEPLASSEEALRKAEESVQQKHKSAVHNATNNSPIENQVKSYSPIPWRPGAVKYFTARGVKM